MKNLYISDLDGTLLNDEAALSDYTELSLNRIIGSGIHFTVASARSVFAIRKMFRNVQLRLPVIEFNGAFISDLQSGRHLAVNSLDREIFREISDDFSGRNVNYFLSSFDGIKDNLYFRETANEGERWYIKDRLRNRDPRLKEVRDFSAAAREEIVCVTLIDTYENLREEYNRLTGSPELEVHLQENRYSPGWFWLTIHSCRATKDQAINKLIQISGLHAPKVTVFGDDNNDIKMLQKADRAVAVANAVREVREVAHFTALSNVEDGVVRYILDSEGL